MGVALSWGNLALGIYGFNRNQLPDPAIGTTIQRANGRTEAARGTAEARNRGIAGNGCQVHGEAPQAAVADVADVSGEPRKAVGIGGLLRGADFEFPNPYVFLVLAHERRRVVYFNVTEHPTAEWAAAQLMQAFPWDTAPSYILRDRDRVYGKTFRHGSRHADHGSAHGCPISLAEGLRFILHLIGMIRYDCGQPRSGC